MSTHLSSKDVNIRKEHICFGCGLVYPTGTRMNYWTGKSEGAFFSTYHCMTCMELMKVVAPFDDDYPQWWVCEEADARYGNFQMPPEELLERIKQEGGKP